MFGYRANDVRDDHTRVWGGGPQAVYVTRWSFVKSWLLWVRSARGARDTSEVRKFVSVTFCGNVSGHTGNVINQAENCTFEPAHEKWVFWFVVLQMRMRYPLLGLQACVLLCIYISADSFR